MRFKFCNYCNKKFHRDNKVSDVQWEVRKHCSYYCSNKARQLRVDKCCLSCGENFVVKLYRNNIAKFCSRHCSKQWSSANAKSPINYLLRRSKKFSDWRKAVFERDNYTCQICNKRGGRLHPHHIKQFALYPELRFVLSNGQTLCECCHKTTDTWGKRITQIGNFNDENNAG